MNDTLFFISTVFVFFLLILLPFIPTLIEIIKKRDTTPLLVDRSYVKDPGYFGKSFLSLLEKKLEEIKEYDLPYEISLSSPYKKERIIKKKGILEEGDYQDTILVLEGLEVRISGKVSSNKEMVIIGGFTIDHPLSVRSLLVKGKLTIKAPLNVIRWLYIEDEVEIRAPSKLGVSFYTSKEVRILAPVWFKRLFAEKIVIGNPSDPLESLKDSVISMGTIRSYGKLIIEAENKGLIVEGNVISEEDIEIKRNVWIKGNVFSHQKVVISENCIISEPSKVKTVFGKKSIKVSGGVQIYGYLHTEGLGILEP